MKYYVTMTEYHQSQGLEINKMLPKIRTEAPNFTLVFLPKITLWYSYQTCVAFQQDGHTRRVCENVWSSTTGKHINSIDGGDKKNRLPRAEFEKQLLACFES
jgi:hypothetical protein